MPSQRDPSPPAPPCTVGAGYVSCFWPEMAQLAAEQARLEALAPLLLNPLLARRRGQGVLLMEGMSVAHACTLMQGLLPMCRRGRAWARSQRTAGASGLTRDELERRAASLGLEVIGVWTLPDAGRCWAVATPPSAVLEA